MKRYMLPAALVSSIFMLISLFACTSPGKTTTTTSLPPTSATTSPTATQTPTGTTTPPTTIPLTPVIPTVIPPAALIGNGNTLNSTQYVVFAWNDLGMHCANPTYDKAVLLPPYNNLFAQVIKRGSPPQVITAGLSVEYSIVNNTYSYGKGSYSQFWDNMQKLFGVSLPQNKGLNLVDPNINNGLSGTMAVKGDHFEADGIPVTPLNDDGTWNPYQVGKITVKDTSGKVVAETYATIPISDEINCSKCHGADAFQDILQKHDNSHGTSLVNQEPVLCASCHGDPALGKPDAGPYHYLSEHIHMFHSTVNPQPACYDCHPGNVTQCSRSLAHTAAGGSCTTCHGSLERVGSSINGGRIPWANEPTCVSCHPGVAEVDTQAALYRNSTGHGGVYCTSCHSSPHAMIPSKIALDQYQAMQYQGSVKVIGSCGACHDSSRGDGSSDDYAETHGGSSPRVANACMTCHTSVTTNTSQWPHAFQWQATQGTGKVDDD